MSSRNLQFEIVKNNPRIYTKDQNKHMRCSSLFKIIMTMIEGISYQEYTYGLYVMEFHKCKSSY